MLKNVDFCQKLNNMKLKEIQDLIKFVAKSGATEVDLELDGVKISIKSPPKKKRGEKEEPTTIIHHTGTSSQLSTLNSSQVTNNAPVKNITEKEEEPEIKDAVKDNKEENYTTIKSSMIGTFYRKSSPEKPEFVNVGDKINPGDTICIIEAMKLFNEIESEVSGTIIKVLVDDGTPVEFEQDLFLIDPS